MVNENLNIVVTQSQTFSKKCNNIWIHEGERTFDNLNNAIKTVFLTRKIGLN